MLAVKELLVSDREFLKPLIQASLQEISKRNDVVLDPFVGGGATIVAAERSGAAVM